MLFYLSNDVISFFSFFFIFWEPVIDPKPRNWSWKCLETENVVWKIPHGWKCLVVEKIAARMSEWKTPAWICLRSENISRWKIPHGGKYLVVQKVATIVRKWRKTSPRLQPIQLLAFISYQKVHKQKTHKYIQTFALAKFITDKSCNWVEENLNFIRQNCVVDYNLQHIFANFNSLKVNRKNKKS